MKFEIGPDKQVYITRHGMQLCADSLEILRTLPENSVDLIVTSPPFALLRQKSYGNAEQSQYIEWLSKFGEAAYRILKPTGSFVLDLGGAYERGKPVRSLYNFRVLIRFCDSIGYRLAEEFYWYNPAKLPSPIEWVNKRKIRVKDAVNTVWWFSKTDFPKSDVTHVLVPYSDRMKALLKDAERFYRPKDRPSGHEISKAFDKDNGGAIPSNLIQAANTDSNSHYLRMCKSMNRDSHPARFPEDLPRFFIKLLTEPGDLVMDIFSGSNTTGFVAELLDRRWISVELDHDYAALSALRFMEDWEPQRLTSTFNEILSGKVVTLDSTAKSLWSNNLAG